MWYLSRTPISALNSTQPNNNIDNLTLRNSIFPTSDTGIFQDISIIQVPNEQQKPHCNNDQTDQKMYTCNLWEWFAYLSSPVHFHSVVVPRTPPFRIQVLAVSPGRFLCAKLSLGPHPYAALCSYACGDNELLDVPQMHCQDRNIIGAASALLNGWLYVSGGYKGNPSGKNYY